MISYPVAARTGLIKRFSDFFSLGTAKVGVVESLCAWEIYEWWEGAGSITVVGCVEQETEVDVLPKKFSNARYIQVYIIDHSVRERERDTHTHTGARPAHTLHTHAHARTRTRARASRVYYYVYICKHIQVCTYIAIYSIEH